MARNGSRMTQGPKIERKEVGQNKIKQNVIEMIPNDNLLYLQISYHLTQLLPERFPTSADGSKCRDLQPNIRWSSRNLDEGGELL